MPKQRRLTSKQAERLLLGAGFHLIRSSGSHRIYKKGGKRIVLPFHGSKVLHPKITRQVIAILDDKEE